MKEYKLLNRVLPGKENKQKREILRHAADCFREYGIAATSIEMIKEKSKFSVGSIYHHFKNKEAIIAQLVLAAVEDLYNYRQLYLLDAKNFEECIYALVLSYLDWVEDHPHFAYLMLSEKLEVHAGEYCEILEEKRAFSRQRIVDWLLLPENKTGLNDDVPYDLYSSFINGIPEHYCKYWFLERVKGNPKMYKKQIALAVWGVFKSFRME